MLSDTIKIVPSVGLIVIVVVLVARGLYESATRNRDKERSDVAISAIRRCGECGQIVAQSASECRHCLATFNAASAPSAGDAVSDTPTPAAKNPAQWAEPTSPSHAGVPLGAPSNAGGSSSGRVAPRDEVRPNWDAATFTTIGASLAFVLATSGYGSNLWVSISTAGNFQYYSALIALAVGGLASWSVATRSDNRGLVTKVAIGYAVGAFIGLVGLLEFRQDLIEALYYGLVAVCIVLSVLSRRGENAASLAGDTSVEA